MASEKLGGYVAKLINALEIEELSNEELLQDLPGYAKVLRDLQAVNAYAYVLNKEDIAITDADAFAQLAEDALSLVVVDNKFADLLVKLVEKVLGVDLSEVELTDVDYEAEQELLVEAVRNGIVLLNSVGVDNLSEVKPYAKEFLSAVKADVKEAIELAKDKHIKTALKALLDTVVEEGRKADPTATLNLFDLACESELVAKFALPIYEQVIAAKFSGTLRELADLSDYDEALLKEDIVLVQQIVKDLYESKLYEVILTRELPGEQAIPYLERMVRNAAQLNILEVKKADILVAAQAVLNKFGVTEYIQKFDKDFDLTKYDLDTVSFKADAEIYVSMVPYAYVAMEGLLESGLNASYLANTDAIYALVEMYTIAIDTTLVQTFANKVFAVVDKLNAKLPITINVNEEEVLYNISDFLFGLIELGVFSNNGIDFTDAETIEMMKEAVLNSVAVPAKLETYINRACTRLYAYGVVPFNWNEVNAKAEIKLAYKLAKLAVNFVKENASSIKAKDLAMIADANVQADLIEMINVLSESSFVEQLFFPFVEGTFNALTLSYTDGEMVYDATLEDVVNISVPNFFKVVNAVYEITEFKRANINAKALLSNLDAVASIVEVLGTDPMTKGNVAKVMITLVGHYTNIEFTEEEINGLLAIDFANEVQYSNKFFAELKETYEATSFSLSLSSIKNPEVLAGLADALEAVLPSETVKVLVKLGAKVVNAKVVTKVSKDIYGLVDTRLSDESLTNELLVEDLYKVAELMRLAKEANVLGNTKEYAVWNFDAIREIIALCFDTNVAQGYENKFAEAVIKLVPQINEYYNETVVVEDWEAEALAIVDVLEALVADGITEISDINVDALSGNTIECILKSVILSNLVVEKINEKLNAQGLSAYYQVTKESLNMVSDWDKELAAIKDLSKLMNGNVELVEVIAQCKNIRTNTVLVNDILVKCAPHVVVKLPVVNEYYDEEMAIEDWAAELDAIIAAYEALNNAHLDTVANPVESLNGEIILACLESEILKAAFVEEFNANLVTYGLAIYYTATVEVIESIDSDSAWDNELVGVKTLESLVAKINDQTVTLADVKAAKEVVEKTTIAKAILEKLLNDEGVSTSRYSSVEEMVADFLADIAAWKGVSVSDIDMTDNITFRNTVGALSFFASTEDNANNPDYKVAGVTPFWNVPEHREKWSWLLDEMVRVMITYPGSSQYAVTLGHLTTLKESYYASSTTFPMYAFWYFLTGNNGSYWGVKFGNGHNAEWL